MLPAAPTPSRSWWTWSSREWTTGSARAARCRPLTWGSCRSRSNRPARGWASMTENLTPQRGPAQRPTRLRSAGVIGVAGIAGVAMGLGATSLALWNDDVTFTGSITSGYEYFAAGIAGTQLTTASGDAAPPEADAVPVTVGAQEARTLAEDGELALVFQTESLSQGNKGLQYTLAPPQDWGEGYFGASEVHLYWVDEPGQCTVGGQ